MSGNPALSFSASGTMPIDLPSSSDASPRTTTSPQPPGLPSQGSSFFRSAWSGLVRAFSYEDEPITSASSFREVPPLEPVCLSGWKPGIHQRSKLLTEPLAEEIRKLIPERLQIPENWSLVYSLVQDGTLLQTLYRKCHDFNERKIGQRIGYVVIVRDAKGGIFGAYMSDAPRISKSYYGNGECFLWRTSKHASLPPPPSADTTNLHRNTTIPSPTSTNGSSNGGAKGESSRFKVYPYSGKNDYFILCEPTFLSLGAGDGHYGLWMNETLATGHSDPCPTYDNERLSDQGGKFDILGVEVWGIGG